MTVLTHHRYGKAGVRLFTVEHRDDRHEIADLALRIALSGDFEQTYLTGDNSGVLPTDSQRNAVYALAAEHGVRSLEEFGLLLARHFLDNDPSVSSAEIHVRQAPWDRLTEQHSFVKLRDECRFTTVQATRERWSVISGVDGLSLLNSTNSEFRGFRKDVYTTLAETSDRILATHAVAGWRYAGLEHPWDKNFAQARNALMNAFTATYSRSLQQTLYEMGQAVLHACGDVDAVRLRLRNLHHLPAPLAPLGVQPPAGRQIFVATDQPYGLIEGSVARAGAQHLQVGGEPW
jgi:urate oxidase